MMYRESVKMLARAIATAEGFYSSDPNVIPRRAHNPGDLKLPASMSPLGYDKGHTIFASDEDGWEALHRQIQLILDGRSKVYTLSMTLRDMAEQYAVAWRPWLIIVSRVLGVQSTTPLQEILVEDPVAGMTAAQVATEARALADGMSGTGPEALSLAQVRTRLRRLARHLDRLATAP